MSKKPYDLSKMENELKGASAFFKSPAASESATDHAAPSTGPALSTNEAPHPAAENTDQKPRTNATSSETISRTPVRSVRPVRPVRRQMIRHPFELYQDQVESLRQLAMDDRMRGGAGSMSAMVREVIDRLIDERSNSAD